jgi:hypothetical protein
MSKIKVRCSTCGKWFQSANAKETTCPECAQKARREKMAGKISPTATGAGAQGNPATPRQVPPPPKPKTQTGGPSWLDNVNDVKIGEPDQPPRPKLPSSPAPRDNRGTPDRERDNFRGPGQGGPGGYRDRDERDPGGNREGGHRGPGGYRENDYRSPNPNYRSPSGPYRVGGGMGLPDTAPPRPRQPMIGVPSGPGGPNRGPRPDRPEGDRFRPGDKRDGKPAGLKKAPKPALPPKPKREKIPPPAPFVPTPEQITQVETRYAELAAPAEFDGIRTQIAKELSIPKSAVKKIVKEYREKNSIPSWWEAQTYQGESEELEKIKAAYEPLLPLPAVGIHKQIAEELSLKPGAVYQAIKQIRLDMQLPQFNDPALHGLDMTTLRQRKKADKSEEQAAGSTETGEESEQNAASTETVEAMEKVAASNGTAEATELHAESKGDEENAKPDGPVSSIETDVPLQRVHGTVEVVPAPREGTSADKVAE